ncbi:MAG: T9SS type A sorting domain-containing protein [Lewinellaceae bacterium]|nr:T9SS type A sorting domain-containing protein [Saprospiraceae bacterium]MCB9339325.1 T9SS type A sorting domain-containing protein [Lewinellaceae bacterium]
MRPPSLNIFLLLGFFCLPLFAHAQLTDTTRVAINDMGSYREIENGYLGVRIPKSSLYNPSEPDLVPAPLRSVAYRDGWVSNDFKNYLESPTPATSMADSILYQTDDSCAIRISYTFDKPDLIGGTGVLEPAGPGYYRVTFRMVKGEKVCIVTEESDFEVGYRVKVSEGLFPDKARWIGHHATSIENGYDPNGNIYDKGDLVGWQATIDLDFTKARDFEPLAKWSPFAPNTGWHWQLYNSQDANTTNTFGIFDGRPSLLWGAAASGAGFYIQPSAITDLTAACDTDGNCHLVWMSENIMVYKKVNADGTSEPEVPLANAFINPFVFVNGDVVTILAKAPDSPPSGKLRFIKKTGSGNFDYGNINLDAEVEDPYLYGASNGIHDFILVKGKHNGQSGLLLYAADANQTNFTYRDMLPFGAATRSADRPDIRTAPNGDIVVAYTAGAYQSYNIIPKDSVHFQLANDVQPFGQQVTFGMAIDPRTGDFFWVKNDGTLHYVDLQGQQVSNTYSSGPIAVVNHQGFRQPNRRSIATDGSGNALAWHEGMFFYFDNSTKNWSELTGSIWQDINPAHVHFSTASQAFQILGKYQGKLARFNFSGSGSPVMEELYPTTERQTSGVYVRHKRVAPTGVYFPDIRFQWCIFAGNKNEDLPPVDQVQTIAKVMNRISGLALKVDGYENKPLVQNDAFKTGGLYVPTADAQAIVARVKNDNTFYAELLLTDPAFKDILDAWRDGTGAKTNQVYQKIIDTKNDIVDALTNGDGIFTFRYQYTAGANTMRRLGDEISGLLADDKLSTTQRESLCKAAALFARILWDDDYVPLFTEHGLSFGTANSPQTYTGQRWFFALISSQDGEFAARAAGVPAKLQQILNSQINEAGAPVGTPHYLQPPMDLIVFTSLQMKNAGIMDKFASSDTLHRFSDFLLHLLTPANVRFGGDRKLISIGDGSEESAAIFGLLASGFAGVDDALSKKLIYAYRHGPSRGSEFGYITLAINHNLEEDSIFNTTSGNFPGYLSHFRSANDTQYESALWFVNGEWYSDHRNDDRGGLSIYALGAPLSLSYGSFYTPHVPGAHMKSTVVPLSAFPEWNQANLPFELPNNQTWYTSQQEGYLNFKNSGYARATYTHDESWTRSVYQFHPKPERPIIIVKDQLSNANERHIWNFNFMSKGDVGTPQGAVTPPSRLWNYNGGPNQQPSTSPPIALSNGLNRFDFTGAEWPVHPANGIDWELYLAAPDATEANLGEWAQTFAPSTEQAEFLAVNGIPYEERQTILRVNGKDEFLAVIVPYFKNKRPGGMQVQQTGDTIRVTADSFLFETDLRFSLFENYEKTILTAFTPLLLEYGEVSIENGPAEMEIVADTLVFVRLHGESGTRTVKLPTGKWELLNPSADAAFDSLSGLWSLDYVYMDSLHNTWEGGYSEFVFHLLPEDTVTIDKTVERQGQRKSLKIYPNPTNGTVNLAFDAPTAAVAQVSFYDVRGSVVFDQQYAVGQGENLIQVILGDVADGVYSVKARMGKLEREGVFLKK